MRPRSQLPAWSVVIVPLFGKFLTINLPLGSFAFLLLTCLCNRIWTPSTKECAPITQNKIKPSWTKWSTPAWFSWWSGGSLRWWTKNQLQAPFGPLPCFLPWQDRAWNKQLLQRDFRQAFVSPVCGCDVEKTWRGMGWALGSHELALSSLRKVGLSTDSPQIIALNRQSSDYVSGTLLLRAWKHFQRIRRI